MPSRPPASAGDNLNQSPNQSPGEPTRQKLGSDSEDPTGFVPFQEGVAPEVERANQAGAGPTQAQAGSAARRAVSSPPNETASPKRSAPTSRLPRPAGQSLRSNPSGWPVQSPVSPSPTAAAAAYRPQWRQAGRAKQWPGQSRPPRLELLLVQAITAIALFWGLRQGFYWGQYQLVMRLTQVGFRLALPSPPFWSILIGLGTLFLTSRWLLDALLTHLDGLHAFSLEQLAIHSPEAARLLHRYGQQRRVAVPRLGLLPTTAPIALTYGCLPRFSRLVISQGLLNHLSDDEIAAIIAREIGNLDSWTVPLLSLITALLQLPFALYRGVAAWGDRQPALLRGLAIAVSGLSYSVFWLLRWFGLWLSRHRVEESDQRAVTLTGNPNGLTRGLLKIAIGTAQDLEQQGATAEVLEGFELLSPLGYRMAIPLGSLYPHTPLEPLLKQEQSNPYRGWLSINGTHPPTSDRLSALANLARQWRLAPELDLGETTVKKNRDRSLALTPTEWRSLLLQSAPLVGLLAGILLALLLALLGWVALQFKFANLAWMHKDPALIRGLPLIGFCLGTFIRLNPFFPDIPKPSNAVATHQPLVSQLQTIGLLPIQGQPTHLHGKLLGRGGMGNRLHQDLWLHTRSGILRLHCISAFGPLGDLLPQANRPECLKNQDLTVSGWLRRGLTPWLDVEQLRTSGGRTLQSYHPIWSVVGAVLAALLGLSILAKSG